MQSEAHSLWRSEAWASLKLAAPLALTQFLSMMIVTTDVMMLGRMGERELAAAGLSASIFSLFYMFGGNFVQATAPIAAQARGAGHDREVAPVVRAGFQLGLLIGLASCAAILLISWLLLPHIAEADLVANTRLFLLAVMISIIPATWVNVLRSFMSVIGHANSILWIMTGGVLAKVGLNFLFLYEFEWGLAGAGFATVLAYLVMTGAGAAFVSLHSDCRSYKIFRDLLTIQPDHMRELVRVGLPIGGAIVMEVGLFSLAVPLMAQFGETAVAAHQIALNIASLSFMVVLGLSHATVVRVGFAAGAGSVGGVWRAAIVNLAFGSFFMSLAALAFVAMPDFIISLFLGNKDASPNVATLAASFLMVAALFQLVDAAQVVSAGALRGLKDTRAAFYLCLISYWLIGMPLCLLFGFGMDLKGVGIWLGLAGGLATAALLLFFRFRFQVRKMAHLQS